MSRVFATMILAAALAGPHAAEARSRARRQILPTELIPTVHHIIQGPDGFIWLGSSGGLLRYDGEEVVKFHPDVIARTIDGMAVAGDGTVYVSEQGGGLYRVASATDVVELTQLDGRSLARVTAIAVDAAGRLWVAEGGKLLRMDDGAHWEHPLSPDFEGAPRELLAAPEGVWIGTKNAVWLASNGRVERKFGAPNIKQLARTSDGVMWATTWDDGTWRYRPGAAEAEPAFSFGGIHMAARDNELLFTHSDKLVRVSGDRVEHITVADGYRSGGAIGVDDEGGVWIGARSGLFHYPAIDTAMWTHVDGLSGPAGRFLARTDEGLWVSTWQGLGRILPDGSARTELVVRDQICTDGRGVLWATPNEDIVARVDGEFVRFPIATGGGEGRCSRNVDDGTVWIVQSGALYRTPAEPGPPTRVPGPWDDELAGAWPALHQAADGTLWLARGRQVCRTNGASPGPWHCERIDAHEGARVMWIDETGEGQLWMLVLGEGAMRWDGERWRWIPASRRLPTRWVREVRPSPRGGAWITGQDFTIRAVPDGDDWRVVEELSWRHGLLSAGAEDILEDDDGTLWIAGQAGTVVRIPPKVRFAELPAPRVIAARAHGDGTAIAVSGTTSLPADVDRVDITFRALTYREPSRVRYRVRVDGGPWSEPRDDATFAFLAPKPGGYAVEAIASVDGRHWSKAPARVQFVVARAWYSTWWAWTLFALAACAALYAAHRARVAVQLRLERQRLRIAMDLHDDVGSGLGSISVLAGVAAEGSVDARDVAARIADTASDLGQALGGIVWSLREGSAALGPLVDLLKRRGEALVATQGTELAVDAPTPCPHVPLSLPVVRNLQLIGLEALHNAARHAGASRIELSVRKRDRTWTLAVTDDGRGLPETIESGGLGLSSMRRRAEDIGATLSIGPGPGGAGTRVAITFGPGAADARVTARSRGLPRASTRES